MAWTHTAVHVNMQSDSGSNKPAILLLSQHYLIAIFLQLTHDQTRPSKNRCTFFFSTCCLSLTQSQKGACPYLIWLSSRLLTHPIVVWGAARQVPLASVPVLFAADRAQTVNCRFHRATGPDTLRYISSRRARFVFCFVFFTAAGAAICTSKLILMAAKREAGLPKHESWNWRKV